jgi:UDPglucose 6-dehydrogenase
MFRAEAAGRYHRPFRIGRDDRLDPGLQGEPMPSNVAVIGTGYVGLTTGACLSHLGHDVVCADIDASKIDRLNKGEIPILEEGLEEIVRECVRAGRLRFVLGSADAMADREFVFLCVPTPQEEDGSADLSYIEAAAAEIAPHLESESIVINKSTVPVGSTRVVEQALQRSDVFVVSNPEFLREGSAVHDFLHPDRVVIGSDDQAAAIRVASLYLGLAAPLMVTDPASAETIKYASNAFLASKISFVNAIAAVCEAVGADVNDVVLGMGYDKRIGQEFLRPGPGWGGSCFLPNESLLVRRGTTVSMEPIAQVVAGGPNGLEVLSWVPGDPTPEFLPVAAVTERPWSGEIVEVRTKMGRRLHVTPDHPMVVGDGSAPAAQIVVTPAGELTDSSWVPLAVGWPLPLVDPSCDVSVLDAVLGESLDAARVIVRLSDRQWREVEPRLGRLPYARRRDVARCRAMRLTELRSLGVVTVGGAYGTTTNGTYVPDQLRVDEDFWRMLGLYLAEGFISVDGPRHRIAWTFHPTDETELVDFVRRYWERHGVKVRVDRTPTSMKVSISSRLLAEWFRSLGVGVDCYSKRVPDLVWTMSDRHRWALLRGLWDGDGSWSFIQRGHNVVLEYGTVSSSLADGMLRLLGGLGIVASQRIGRTPKSTVDTHWLRIAGQVQVAAAARELLPSDEVARIRCAALGLTKRIAPTGYRPDGKNAAWVRVTGVERLPYEGPVYSLEVPGAHTVVTTSGLVAHNCFPKDSHALVRIAEDAGYDFRLLRGVIEVNTQQFERVVDKVEAAAGGSLDGVKVAAWGITFKARTDDTRDSPAIEIIHRLQGRGAIVSAYDPAIHADIKGIPIENDPYAACSGAEVLAVLTEWDEFKWLDLDKVASEMAHPRIVDARNLMDRQRLRQHGFEYQGIGRS